MNKQTGLLITVYILDDTQYFNVFFVRSQGMSDLVTAYAGKGKEHKIIKRLKQLGYKECNQNHPLYSDYIRLSLTQ